MLFRLYTYLAGDLLHTANLLKAPEMFFTPYYVVGATARPAAAFGEGSDPILLDHVRCSGPENRLFDCAHNGIEVISTSCGHHKDAGVVCMRGINAFCRHNKTCR